MLFICFLRVNLRQCDALVLWPYLLFLGSPEAAEFQILSTDDPLVFELRWSKPKENGAPITKYTIYRRLVGKNGQKEQWDKIKTLSVDAPLSYNVTLAWGKHFEFVVTATNRFGEATKEDNRIEGVERGTCRTVLFTTIF